MGQRRNMNGAGYGGRFVGNGRGGITLGGRSARQADLEDAFRIGTGLSDKNKALGRRNRAALRNGTLFS